MARESPQDEAARAAYVKTGINPDARWLDQMDIRFDPSTSDAVKVLVNGWREPIADGYSGAGLNGKAILVTVEKSPRGSELIVLTITDPFTSGRARIEPVPSDGPHHVKQACEYAGQQVSKKNPVVSGAAVSHQTGQKSVRPLVVSRSVNVALS